MSSDRRLSETDEAALARYRAGEMDDPERTEFERRLAGDDLLADAMYAEESLDSLSNRPVVRRRRSALVYVLPAAAVVLLALFISQWRRSLAPDEEVLRGSASAIELLEPIDEIDAPPSRFRWTADAGAERYRVEIYDERGSLLNTALVAGSSVSAAELGAAGLLAGEWRVVPIDDEGFERAASARARYRVRRD